MSLDYYKMICGVSMIYCGANRAIIREFTHMANKIVSSRIVFTIIN